MAEEKHKEGIFIVGRVLNVEEKKGVSSKSGNPYHMITYMVLCGQKVCSVQQTQAETAPLHPANTIVSINIEPSFRDNGVILMSGDLVKL
jgi:hypothetical protein